MGVPLWYNIKSSQNVHHPWEHILGILLRWFLKNVNISMQLSLLEKQNWYYADHKSKDSKMNEQVEILKLLYHKRTCIFFKHPECLKIGKNA